MKLHWLIRKLFFWNYSFSDDSLKGIAIINFHVIFVNSKMNKDATQKYFIITYISLDINSKSVGVHPKVQPEIDFLTREWAALTMVCCFKKLLWNVKDDLQSVRHKSRLHSGGQWPNVFLAGKMSDRCSPDFGQSSIRKGRLEDGPHGPKIQIVGTICT